MPIFETPGSVVLEIRLPAGHVTVKSGDEPKTDVELVARGRRGEEAIEQIEVSARDQPGGHVVSIEQRDRFRWGPISINWGSDVEVRITCPAGADLDFDGASVDLGAISARFMVWGEESGGGFSLVEHPIPPRTLWSSTVIRPRA